MRNDKRVELNYTEAKNGKFIYSIVPKNLEANQKLSGNDMKIIMFMCNHYTLNNGNKTFTDKSIYQSLGMAKNTFIQSIKNLTALNYLESNSSAFQLNIDVILKDNQYYYESIVKPELNFDTKEAIKEAARLEGYEDAKTIIQSINELRSSQITVPNVLLQKEEEYLTLIKEYESDLVEKINQFEAEALKPNSIEIFESEKPNIESIDVCNLDLLKDTLLCIYNDSTTKNTNLTFDEYATMYIQYLVNMISNKDWKNYLKNTNKEIVIKSINVYQKNNVTKDIMYQFLNVDTSNDKENLNKLIEIFSAYLNNQNNLIAA